MGGGGEGVKNSEGGRKGVEKKMHAQCTRGGQGSNPVPTAY